MKFALLLFCSFLAGNTNQAQGLRHDSLDVDEKKMIALYHRGTDNVAPLFNGRAYIYFTFKMEGTPFFGDKDLSTGWVGYDGKMYDPLSLSYDVARDEVVVLLPDSNSRAVLHNELVDSFKVAGNTFVKLHANSRQNLNLTAFYQVLYRGGIQVFAKRTKRIDEEVSPTQVLRIFYPKDFYYVRKDDVYYLVSNKRDVYRVLARKKNDIKKALHRKHLKLKRKTFEEALLAAVMAYDKVSQKL